MVMADVLMEAIHAVQGTDETASVITAVPLLV
jgi:hypothetical protein